MSDVSTTYSGTTGAGGGSRLRITGMASGLDVDATVKKMLTAEQTKIDKANQTQQINTWKQETYLDIIKDVKNLQNTYFSSTSADSLTRASNYSAFDVTSSTSAVATATANTGAAEGTYVVKVNKLAKTASVSGSSLNSQITYVQADIANWKGHQITFNNGSDISFTISSDAAVATGDDIVSDINKQISNSSLSGKVSATYVDDGTNKYIKFNNLTGDNITVKGDGTDFSSTAINVKSSSSSSKLTALDATLNTTINLNLNYNGTNKTVTLDNTKGDKTIADLAAAISQTTGGDVTASLDEMTGQFKLQTKATGSTSILSVDAATSTSNLLSALGNLPTTQKQGQDANVTITAPGGTATTVTESSNNFTINNVNYRLTSEDAANNTTNLTVTSNVDKVFDRIVAFKDKYNTLIDKIYTKLTEKKSSKFPPLTDAQKSSMKDSDIQTWNDKAKVGILRNDNRLQNLLSDLRNVFYTPVNGSSMNFGSKSLGLDLSDDVTKPGQLEFIKDTGEQTFKDALRNNGADVMSLFLKSPTSTAKIGDNNYENTTFKEEGIMNRIQDILSNNIGLPGVVFTTDTKGILTKYVNFQDDFSMLGSSGTGTLKDQMYQQTNVIKTLNDKFKDKQEAYYQKFSKLETAMQTLNSQQSQLSSFLGQ